MIGNLWIGIGGALGTIARAWLTIAVARITARNFRGPRSSSILSAHS